jgi:outer membrane receptor protein involved in Fe transport
MEKVLHMRKLSTKPRQLGLAITAASLAMCAGNAANAQEQDTPKIILPLLINAPAIEEMIVSGRLKTSAQSVIEERLDQAFAADLLGSEQIGRTGDSNVAAALLRVTGVTLIDNKYVYVRSLGERYSSTLLNGAAVPSPELTRNVLPLDLIPASIVETLKIQKAYSPDLPANFGGGNIDIRTKNIPDEFVFNIGFGTGINTQSTGNGLAYSGGGDENGMPAAIYNALDLYQGGTLGVQSIRQKSHLTQSEAVRVNRDLALSLDRNINIREKSLPLDLDAKIDLGNSWSLSEDFTLGALLTLSQNTESRNKNFTERGVGSPTETFSSTERTLEEIRQLASFNLGLNYQDMHQLSLNSYLINNTEDDALIKTGFNSNYSATGDTQYVNYDTRYEERELQIIQLLGEHTFDQFSGAHLGEIKFDWFSSDAQATTDTPNQTRVQGFNIIDAASGDLINTSLLSTTSMATFAFLELQDDVKSYGWNLHVPLTFDKTEIKFSAGYSYNDKARKYYGYTANLNATGVTSNVLTGTPGSVLTDENIGNLNNGFDFSMGTGFGTESYIAAQMTDAAYAMLDLTWNYQWRVTAGARYEDFKQALLPLDLLDYSGASIQKLIADLQKDNQAFARTHNDWYPSLAITYMNEGFMNTDNFHVRASYSKTLVRPDLREVSDVSYIDPESSVRVQGNPNLLSSDLDHFDLRTEWFYNNGDNFTVSLFYKDIANPIEQSRRPGSDDNIELVFYNALAGEIYGVELEGLKDLGAGYFLSSNITLSKSKIVSPEGEGYTNSSRNMTGQSEYVVNTQLGYDADNGMHSVSLVYNIFGERVYYAARNNGYDDAFEQPFNSVDLIYSYYPTEKLTAKFKVTNLLNEKRKFTQKNGGNDVTILEQDVGTGVSLDLTYSF